MAALIAIMLATAVAAQAQDAVSVATSAVTDIWLRPLRLSNLVLSVRTEYFQPGTMPDTVFVDVYESRTCCVPVAGSQPLLSASVFVQDGRLRNVTASGRLLDHPPARSSAHGEEVEREVLAAIEARTSCRGIESSAVKRVKGREVRRVVLATTKTDSPASNRSVFIDTRAHVPRLLELP